MTDLYQITFSITPATLAYISLFGLIWGDFIGMMVMRTHRHIDQLSKGIEPEKQGLNVYGGRSQCMHCNKKIPWYYNVPIIGWVHLRGVSSCCSMKISKVYPVTEIFFMIAAPAAFWVFSPAAAFIFLAATTICYIASYVDLRTMHIPIEGNYLLLLLSFLVMASYSPDPTDKIIYAIVAWLAIHIINSISPQQVIGEGDIPIIVSIVLISFSYLFNVAIIIASFVTIAIFAYNLVKHKSYSLARMVPFGPGLCAAYVVTLALVLQETPFS